MSSSGGFFVTFEGVEGVGKSTQVRLLASRLESLGQRVLQLREPGATPLGEKLRDLLKFAPESKGIEPLSELLLLSASRVELLAKVIRPALKDGAVVLVDRFFDSTLAYQGGGRGLDLEVIRKFIELTVGSTRPDMTFWLRIPAAEIHRRLRKREMEVAADHFDNESAAFFQRVEQTYSILAADEPQRFISIDGVGTQAEVSARIWSAFAGQPNFNFFPKMSHAGIPHIRA